MLRSRESDVYITVFDVLGKQVINDRIGKTTNVEYDLKTSNFNQGIYLLQVKIGETRQSFKIMKE